MTLRVQKHKLCGICAFLEARGSSAGVVTQSVGMPVPTQSVGTRKAPPGVKKRNAYLNYLKLIERQPEQKCCQAFSGIDHHHRGGQSMKPQKETTGPHQGKRHGLIRNLHNGLKRIESDLEESQEREDVCAGEWCRNIGLSLDTMAKDLYSISVPRWVADDYARTVRAMRLKLHELYTRYHGACSHCNN